MLLLLSMWMLALAEKEPLTINEALMIAVSVLAGVVAVLFLYLRSVDARQDRKLNECEEDRRQLWKSIVELGGSMPKLKSR